ncbi:ATP-binding protein [Allosphingosinicella indica]|uniref:Helicase HerA central domain-containing protein n=1 Tax=Allosphingosinicella indica TaxID=941907 RepID=A0A1X7GH74_9SPHN|nr:ATP-binding protein [Allosphingosinicella indica]SMF69818.1 hypothetical protein SAMN06295910_1773 [Allosphingosinicella indica]
MTAKIDMGTGDGGTVTLDLEELLSTRLLVQGNSGSGKSHLLRRLLEGSAELVQQIVIDPEGDFVSLGNAFSHVALEAASYSPAEIARMAERVREHRASVVLSLEGLELEAQMRCAATFLSALFDAPRDHWFPALVVVDEAQVFAPAAAGEVSDEARRASLGAMTNLMCRGRKRGLAGVIATQRLAKLAKNVAAEASNFLMGRTFLDIDMARAADLLGMERRQAEAIRDLERGQFLALGPAITKRPLKIRIGPVRTAARSVSPTLMPLPAASDVESLVRAPIEAAPPPPQPPPPPPPSAAEVIGRIDTAQAALPAAPQPDAHESASIVRRALADLVADAASAQQTVTTLYQDFLTRCRMLGLASAAVTLPDFRRKLAMARAGMEDEAEWGEVLGIGAALPDDVLAPFLLIARAARDGEECPPDEALARAYGTSSMGRVRRLLSYMEEQGVIVTRIDLSGRRAISLPHLGWTTAASEPGADAPRRAARR